jgi:hypothetical protein
VANATGRMTAAAAAAAVGCFLVWRCCNVGSLPPPPSWGREGSAWWLCPGGGADSKFGAGAAVAA